ncbi:hypothetical protein ABDY00_001819 [Yersinia enterocolitica]
MKKSLLIATGLLLSTSALASPINTVKDGVMDICPVVTVEQQINHFLASPQWRQSKSHTPTSQVDVSGKAILDQQPVSLTLQFAVNGDSFMATRLLINGQPTSEEDLTDVLTLLCDNVTRPVTGVQPAPITPQATRPNPKLPKGYESMGGVAVKMAGELNNTTLAGLLATPDDEMAWDGCDAPVTQRMTIKNVTPASRTVTHFTAASPNADVKEFDISDLEGELPQYLKSYLPRLITPGETRKVAWRDCGSAGLPTLVSIEK